MSGSDRSGKPEHQGSGPSKPSPPVPTHEPIDARPSRMMRRENGRQSKKMLHNTSGRRGALHPAPQARKDEPRKVKMLHLLHGRPQIHSDNDDDHVNLDSRLDARMYVHPRRSYSLWSKTPVKA